jgi:predicted Zn-dependent protease with MMP-like domain
VDFGYNPPPYFGAGSASHLARSGGNPNGAAQFAGVLALILAVSLIGSTRNGRTGSGVASLLVISLAVGLLLLALLFFTSSSPLARTATSWMEAEPTPATTDGGAAYTPETEPTPTSRSDTHQGFERLVEQALEAVPEAFQGWLNNVLVEVLDEPTDEMLRQMQVRQGCTLFGLYTGVPLTHHYGREVPPEIITVFQGPIERYCDGDPDAIRDQVRRTVLHELAHHFGMDHDAMPDWIQ